MFTEVRLPEVLSRADSIQLLTLRGPGLSRPSRSGSYAPLRSGSPGQARRRQFKPIEIRSSRQWFSLFTGLLLVAMACLTAPPAAAQMARRDTVWDLKIGAPIAAQPAPGEFRGFACGSNGGAPRAQLAGWADFKRCPPEAVGLHEVYFEY